MAEPFATVADLRGEWADLPSDREAEATRKLAKASRRIRELYPRTDARIESGLLDPDSVMDIVCDMVKRAMDIAAGFENVDNINQQAGPFGATTTFKNTDGKIYLTADEKRVLAGRRDDVPFTIYT